MRLHVSCCAREQIVRAVALGLMLSSVSAQAQNCTAPVSGELKQPLEGYESAPGTFRINSQADADALRGCGEILGHVLIQSNELTSINLTGFQTIRGSLEASSSAKLSQITALDLSTIRGNFTLSNLPVLEKLDIPGLTSVRSHIYWNSIPKLTELNVNNLDGIRMGQGYTVPSNLTISGTGLGQIDFIRDGPTRVQIINNPSLTSVQLAGPTYIQDDIVIRDNHPILRVDLQALRSCDGNITISEVAALNLQALKQASGPISVSNNSFSTFSAPDLMIVSRGLAITNNNLLSVLALGTLKAVGMLDIYGVEPPYDLIIANNPRLKKIDQLANFESATGFVNITGPFDLVELPGLIKVNLGVHIAATNVSTFDCTALDKLAKQLEFSSQLYSCQTLYGTSGDPTKNPTASSPRTIPSFAIGILIGTACLLALSALWVVVGRYRTRHATTAVPREGGRGRGHGDGDGIELGGAVVRTVSTDDDELPKYQRRGRPHEVPPDYDVTWNEVATPSAVATGELDGVHRNDGADGVQEGGNSDASVTRDTAGVSDESMRRP